MTTTSFGDLSSSVIRRQVEAIEFGLYTDDDVRRRSVVEITSPVAFDALQTPLPGGLYDARLGPTDAGGGVPCITCANTYQACPGHFGAVELCVPVYHPLLMANKLQTLLKVKCWACHAFRISRSKTQLVVTQLQLLEQGRLAQALELPQLLLQFQAYLKQSLSSTKTTTAAASPPPQDDDNDDENNPMVDSIAPNCHLEWQGLESVEDFFAFVLQQHQQEEKKAKWTTHARQARRVLLRQYQMAAMAVAQCQSCRAHSPKIRQDGHCKFFQKPLAAKYQQANRLERITLQPASRSQRRQEPPKTPDSDDSQPEDEEEEEDNDDEDEEKAATMSKSDRYLHALEVEAQVRETWRREVDICQWLFGTHTLDAFFLRVIAVLPSRFRPPMSMGVVQVEHAHNAYLVKILQANQQVRAALGQEDKKAQHIERAIRQWIELQIAVNCLFDSSKNPAASSASMKLQPGMKQLLERKEGLFRKNMMGKRVNFACRSVISPDPYIGTNEIGIPRLFAQRLTLSTPVTPLNFAEMRRLVQAGPHGYPGANWVELGPSQRLDLSKMNPEARRALSARLLRGNGGVVRVGRHLRNGDAMLMNRQPTLHKPGIMAHSVRILHSPTQQTIRMHYANCDTYNADFDGDEMNGHYPQSDIARAEARYIVSTDEQFIVPTDGSPLRGLIQDHVDSGVKLTCKDTFLRKWEYQQLIFGALASLPGLEVIGSHANLEMVPPAIRKPEELWTGKQVITTLLHHLCRDEYHRPLPSLTWRKQSKMPAWAFGESQEEHWVLIRHGELLRGVLDKGAFGSTDFSLVHAVHEAYGPRKASLLLNSLGRLFTTYLQSFAGHSCRMQDLILATPAEVTRREIVQRAYAMGTRAAKAWADSDGGKVSIPEVSQLPHAEEALKPFEAASTALKIGQLLSGSEAKTNAAALDGYMQSQLNKLSSEIIKGCLPDGLAVPFPTNTFALMVTVGAKGSKVNQSQVSCLLGQQALEGRRVPRMSSGRTLPSFAPYDPNPRADGFITDRFLTGIRPQEYYFHCMAGREGLVDTAVKTSRSGYLQRCLVKHLEELSVCYDGTVRDGEGGVMQFLYGEDGLDPTKAPYLDGSPNRLEFLTYNHASLRQRFGLLPHATLELARKDSERAQALRSSGGGNNTRHLWKEGSFVRARKLRHGDEWKRGALCRGWFDATLTKTTSVAGRNDNDDKPQTVDLVYHDDGRRVRDVPVQVEWSYPSLNDSSGRSESPSSTRCPTPLVELSVPDPVLSSQSRKVDPYGKGKSVHRPGSSGACVSERVAAATWNAMETDAKVQKAMTLAGLSRRDLGLVVAAKYSSALIAPGEAVGSIAAQSVGEPSTQMTLNTFHLAGSGANVTLGIPRLREIIMTASKTPKTPTMSIPLDASVSDREARRLARSFSRVTLSELLASRRGIQVRETLQQGDGGIWERAYYITLRFHSAERIQEAFGLRLEDLAATVSSSFLRTLSMLMKKELKRSFATDGDFSTTAVLGAESAKMEEGDDDAAGDSGGGGGSGSRTKKSGNEEEDDDDDDEGVGEEDGVTGARFAHKQEMASYGDMDEEEKQEIAATESTLVQENDEDGPTPQTDANVNLVTDDDGDDSDGDDSEDGEDDDDDDANATLNINAVRIDRRRASLVLQPLRVDPAARPLLMVGLVELAAEKTTVRARRGITQGFINDEDEESGGHRRGRCLQTAGVNFYELWQLDETAVRHAHLFSNDIWAVMCAYGVEAGRSTIVQQIRSVFDVYGISVDARHLSLIADYMTFGGEFCAMNRTGMAHAGSAFLQMSFETTAAFLVEAALSGATEPLQSPSANIVVGRPVRHGTGAFECLSAM